LLVRGVPVTGGDIEAKRLTPTGAAILTTLADAWGPLPSVRPRLVGYGADERDLGESPNMLRMILGDSEVERGRTAGAQGEVAVLECTVDDSTPQALAFAMERLFQSGALEAFTTPVIMKKGRAGHHLTVLCRPDRLPELAQVLLANTSSLGLRFSPRRSARARAFGPHHPDSLRPRHGQDRRARRPHEDMARVRRLRSAGRSVTRFRCGTCSVSDRGLYGRPPRIAQESEEVLTVKETPVDDAELGRTAQPVPAGAPKIRIDCFLEIDLRVARVTAAERVENAERLLKLQVDLGGAAAARRGDRRDLRSPSTRRPPDHRRGQPRAGEDPRCRESGHAAGG
jgi:tRNA-binding EMAP/Myf-like protein